VSGSALLVSGSALLVTRPALLVAGRRGMRPPTRHGPGARRNGSAPARRAAGADRSGPERLLRCPALVLVLRITELALGPGLPSVDRRRTPPLIGRGRPAVILPARRRTRPAVVRRARGSTGPAVVGCTGRHAGPAVVGSAWSAALLGTLGHAGRAVPRRLVALLWGHGGAARRVPGIVPILIFSALWQPRIVGARLVPLHRRVAVSGRRSVVAVLP
jgi:hypothetical protein